MAEDVTQLLVDWSQGDDGALETLMPLVYARLRKLAQHALRRERRGHTLQPTALVHEAYLQLIDQNRVTWRSRHHFFGVAAHLMRRITVKHARRQAAAKRGGGMVQVPLDEEAVPGARHHRVRAADVLALDDALTRLDALDPRQSRIVELRFFGGLTHEQTAELLEVSLSTVYREWRMARAWLRRQLAGC